MTPQSRPKRTIGRTRLISARESLRRWLLRDTGLRGFGGHSPAAAGSLRPLPVPISGTPVDHAPVVRSHLHHVSLPEVGNHKAGGVVILSWRLSMRFLERRYANDE